MVEQSRLIYDAISIPENFKKIKDFSDKMLEKNTHITLANTLECIFKQKAIGGITKGIMGMFRGGFGGDFPEDDYKGEGVDFPDYF